MDLNTLQQEVADWAARNFPSAKPHLPLLGIVEELGELYEARDAAQMKDAIGDVTVFAAHYCALNGLSLAEAISTATPVQDPADAYLWLGRLAHSHLKLEEGIRGTPEQHRAAKQNALGQIVACLVRMAPATGACYREIVERVWSEVKQRDWQADRVNGGATPTKE